MAAPRQNLIVNGVNHIYKDACSLAQAKRLPSLISALCVRFVRGAAGTRSCMFSSFTGRAPACRRSLRKHGSQFLSPVVSDHHTRYRLQKTNRILFFVRLVVRAALWKFPVVIHTEGTRSVAARQETRPSIFRACVSQMPSLVQLLEYGCHHTMRIIVTCH